MKIINLNPPFDTNIKVSRHITRVKMFIKNSKNEYLFALADDCYQLPGGHVEENESYDIAINREIEEETGITLQGDTIPKPFLQINRYVDNYRDTYVNVISSVIYFFICTDEEPNNEKIHMTEQEKQYGMHIVKILEKDIKSILQNQINNPKLPIHKAIAEETLLAFEELTSSITQ